MKINKTTILGCIELQPKIIQDARGRLVKTYHQEMFALNGLDTNFTEEYYSTSSKGVLRGLHFQLPPNDHIKCVTCLFGEIFDVVVDLRKDSPSYKKHFSIKLNAEKGNMLYIPKGLAHGFQVLSEKAIFLNRTTTVYHPESDCGVRWDSCGIQWPSIDPILSEKDTKWKLLNKYKSPF